MRQTCNEAKTQVPAKTSLQTTHISIFPFSKKDVSNKKKNLPLKSSKHGGGLGARAHAAEAHAVVQPHGQRDEAGEPEQHGQGLDAEDGELVRGGGEAGGGDDQVHEREDGPDGDEDQIVDLRGRIGVPVRGPPVADWKSC